MFLNTVSPENVHHRWDSRTWNRQWSSMRYRKWTQTLWLSRSWLMRFRTQWFADRQRILELSQPSFVITTGKEIRGLTSTAKGLISSTVPAFRWKLDGVSSLTRNWRAKQPRLFHQRLRVTMNVDFYTETTTLQPKLYMRYNLQEGSEPSLRTTRRTKSYTIERHQSYTSTDIWSQEVGGNVSIGWGRKPRRISPTTHHWTSWRVIEPWTTNQLQLVQRNRVSYIGRSRRNQDGPGNMGGVSGLFERWLSFVNEICNPDIISTSTPTDINDSHNGRQQYETSIDAWSVKTCECFPDIELNPHYPSVDEIISTQIKCVREYIRKVQPTETYRDRLHHLWYFTGGHTKSVLWRTSVTDWSRAEVRIKQEILFHVSTRKFPETQERTTEYRCKLEFQQWLDYPRPTNKPTTR